ncbi:MAG: hypothetical protein ACI8TP_001641 [Acidimicrobiales bacterium]
MTLTLSATHDPPPKGVPNPIHSDEGATSSGYAGSLVAGVRTYGWCIAEIVRSAGQTWLDDGWVDFTLHRPLFVDELLTIEANDGELDASTAKGSVLSGTFGTGSAPFFVDLAPPSPAPGQEAPDPRPGYTLESAPVGEPLRPLSVRVSTGASERLATEDLGVEADDWSARIHPYFLAARMSPITRHNFTYGPTIHFRTQMQHVAPAVSESRLTIGAKIVEVYERNGHWYQVLDGVITAAAIDSDPDDVGSEVARLRHHTIFRPRSA